VSPPLYLPAYNQLLYRISKICEEGINDRKLYVNIIQHALYRFVNQGIFLVKSLTLKGEGIKVNEI
jgi:hypothetical protein